MIVLMMHYLTSISHIRSLSFDELPPNHCRFCMFFLTD